MSKKRIFEKHAWLEPFTWNFIENVNEAICIPGGHLHKKTADGYEKTRSLWELNHKKVMSFEEAMELLYNCHRNAPFCNLNGNTFVAVARKVTEVVSLDPLKAHTVRSICGHIVAGTLKPNERERFQKILNSESLGVKLQRVGKKSVTISAPVKNSGRTL